MTVSDFIYASRSGFGFMYRFRFCYVSRSGFAPIMTSKRGMYMDQVLDTILSIVLMKYLSVIYPVTAPY